MIFPDVTKLSLQEEIELNDPTYSYQWVLENYRKTYNPKLGYGLYEWEPIEFANTSIIQSAVQHFKKYERYNDIDENKENHHWKKWWDREEHRRINGITVPIKVPKGGANSDRDLLPVWIPGKFYGFLNYGPIKRAVNEDDKILNPKQVIKTDKINLLFEGLTDKTVANTKLDFPDFWDGHFHTFLSINVAQRLGLDWAALKARRKGFSYIGAWDAFDEVDMYPGVTVLLVAYDMKYLNKGDRALFNMIKSYADHISKHTDWGKRRLINNDHNLQFGFTYKGTSVKDGYLSEVLAVSAMYNADITRGKQAKKILYEECGTFPNLLSVIGSTQSAMESGNFTVGQSLYWGTVGSAEADYDGLSSLFYSPQGNNILCHNNVYDPNKLGTPCALFFSHLQNFEGGAIDKNGNSNIQKAKEIFESQKAIKKANSKKSVYEKWLAERATTPGEALSRRGTNLFSIHADKISAQINRIDNDDRYRNAAICGRYIKEKGVVRLQTNAELAKLNLNVYEPITDTANFLHKDFNFHGCIQEYTTPYSMETKMLDENGVPYRVVPDKLYYAWHDPYATDKDEKEITQENSLGVTYIYETINNFTPQRGGRIVASWIGRPATTDEYNEQLFYMLERWNAKMLFENDRGDVISYAKRKKTTKWLMEEPELLTFKEMSGKTGRSFGISIGKHSQRKLTGAMLLRDFLGDVIGKDDQGNDILFLETVLCKLFLRQLLSWKNSGNFDTVSAAIVGQFQIRELLGETFQSQDLVEGDDDDFWDRDMFSSFND